jgi:hypothetical protein
MYINVQTCMCANLVYANLVRPCVQMCVFSGRCVFLALHFCCVVLHCVMLCCVVLCCDVQGCGSAVLCCVVSCCAMMCGVVLHRLILVGSSPCTTVPE